MKPKTMILMGLAIVCGLGASYMTSRLLAERQAPPEEEKVKILVAKRNLNVGERILKPDELFEWKEISKDAEPPDAIKDFELLKEKSMKQGRNKGEHVTPANLRSKGEQLHIPEGYKAVGLRVNLEGSASGFATLPQSRVDLVHTVRSQDSANSYSRILLQKVLVLAADLRLSPDGELASPAQVVTFALKDEDLLKVSLAKELGILSLSLRNLDDESVSKDMVVRGVDLGPKKEPPPPVVVVEAKPIPKVEPKKAEPVVEEPKGEQHELLIINGAQQQRVIYQIHDDGRIQEGNGSANDQNRPTKKETR